MGLLVLWVAMNPHPVQQPYAPQWQGVSPVTRNQLFLGGVTVVLTTTVFLALAGVAMFVVGGVALVGVGVILALRHP